MAVQQISALLPDSLLLMADGYGAPISEARCLSLTPLRLLSLRSQLTTAPESWLGNYAAIGRNPPKVLALKLANDDRHRTSTLPCFGWSASFFLLCCFRRW